MEDDVEVLAVVAINYAPDKTLEELWHGTNMQEAMKSKGWSSTVISEKYQQICDELKDLREAAV